MNVINHLLGFLVACLRGVFLFAHAKKDTCTIVLCGRVNQTTPTRSQHVSQSSRAVIFELKVE